jgi:hypothetical protein
MLIDRSAVSLLRTFAETGTLADNVAQMTGVVSACYDLGRDQRASESYLATMFFALELLKTAETKIEVVEKIENGLEPHGVGWHMLDQEVTLDEMRDDGWRRVRMVYERNPNAPKAPFGFKCETFGWMEDNFLEGDRFYEYRSKDIGEWKNLAGQSGYCMVRGNKIICVLTLMRS